MVFERHILVGGSQRMRRMKRDEETHKRDKPNVAISWRLLMIGGSRGALAERIHTITVDVQIQLK
jgi:hypothetical protein